MLIEPFVPHRLLSTGHLQTIFGNVIDRAGGLHPSDMMLVPLPDGDRLALQIDEPAGCCARTPTVVLVHGLCSDGDSLHNRRIGKKLLQQGLRIVRFNHRGANQKLMPFAKSLYHGACHDDLLIAMEAIAGKWPDAPVAAIGFSLSANILLAMAGRYTERLARLGNFLGIMAVCPPVDVGSSSEALGRWRNLVFDQYFTLRMRKILRHHKRVHRLPRAAMRVPLICSVRRFDTRYTRQVLGLESVHEYYEMCSAKHLMREVTIPSVIVASADDPIVPVESIRRLQHGKAVQISVQKSGGHLGFISQARTPWGDRYWLDHLVSAWVNERLGGSSGLKVPA